LELEKRWRTNLARAACSLIFHVNRNLLCPSDDAYDPAAAIKAERARMEKVNKAWPFYLIAWAAFGIGGLTLRFAIPGDFAQGLGIALVFFAGLGLMIDGFAERRARPYAEALNAWQAGAE
jgi:hypothetical protein